MILSQLRLPFRHFGILLEYILHYQQNHPSSSVSKVKVIVTGFNAFGSYGSNPSEESVRALPDSIIVDNRSQSVDIVKLVLPTCCVDAFEILQNELSPRENQPFALILSGLADLRQKISLERFALNVRDFRMPDNNGHQWDEEVIQSAGPDALRTGIDLKDLENYLREGGFDCDISNHAGTFVCNETYYRCLFRWQSNPNCRGILFLHFPPFEVYKQSNPELCQALEPRDAYAQVLRDIAHYLALDRVKRTE